MKLWDKIDKLLFGHDIFISYSRRDGLDYSYKLADRFISRGYDCYIDQINSTTPGNSIPNNILRALKRSTSLLVVGSPQAGLSKSVEEEISVALVLKILVAGKI